MADKEIVRTLFLATASARAHCYKTKDIFQSFKMLKSFLKLFDEFVVIKVKLMSSLAFNCSYMIFEQFKKN